MVADTAAANLRAALDAPRHIIRAPGAPVMPDFVLVPAVDLRAVLDEREQLAGLLGIGVEREQWDVIAETEGRRYEAEQTGNTIVGYLAYRYEDMKAQRHILLREIEELAAQVAGQPVAVAVDFRKASEDDVRKWRKRFEAVMASGGPLVVKPPSPDERRDADTRLIAEFFAAKGFRANVRALQALKAHFEPRVAELEARTADGGAG